MSEVQERIDQMVHSGRLSPAEGRGLGAAVESPPRSRWWALIDPFEQLGTFIGLGIGAAMAVSQLALSWANVRFDGALDMHLVPAQPTWTLAFIDTLVSWPLVALVLWAAAKIVVKKPRFVDMLSAVGVARVPVVLAAVGSRLLIDDPAAFTQTALKGQFDPLMFWAIAIAISMLGWLFVWLYRGYRTASGASGTRASVSFVAAIVVAEVASKALLLVVGGMPPA